jgi:hypothetical protein
LRLPLHCYLQVIDGELLVALAGRGHGLASHAAQHRRHLEVKPAATRCQSTAHS